MTETCTICGHEIQVWQSSVRMLKADAEELEWFSKHANHMDCKPTQEPEDDN